VLTERAKSLTIPDTCRLLAAHVNSNFPFQIVLTERANHARDLLQSLPLFKSNFPFQIVLTERANYVRDL
jgi:hypothetical protein